LTEYLHNENTSYCSSYELRELEIMKDEQLIKIAKKELSITQQERYSYLLRKNSQGNITTQEEKELDCLQDEADRLMLKRAYAYNLLKWRGYSIPSEKEIETVE